MAWRFGPTARCAAGLFLLTFYLIFVYPVILTFYVTGARLGESLIGDFDYEKDTVT